MINKTLRMLAAAAVLACTPAYAQQQPPALVKVFKDWPLYKHQSTGLTVCFVASQPKSRSPRNLQSDKTYFYVSSWPKEGVKAEVSVKMGYEIKKNSTVSVQIGSNVFKLFTDKDNAFVADLSDELKLIEAVKGGSSMVIKGTNAQGQETEDTYSLSGSTAAINAMANDCT
ncbi:MAG: hypothetical protein RLZ98_418 [Pseudomonadota bacterium]|jgi:hypothetical protein